MLDFPNYDNFIINFTSMLHIYEVRLCGMDVGFRLKEVIEDKHALENFVW
jgi:hypothetical protein